MEETVLNQRDTGQVMCRSIGQACDDKRVKKNPKAARGSNKLRVALLNQCRRVRVPATKHGERREILKRRATNCVSAAT